MAAYGKRLQRFFHETKIELKKVNWPTKRELTVFTSIVLVVIIIFGIFFWIIDAGLTAVLKLLI
jgi:preprotein translocase subunit SecE